MTRLVVTELSLEHNWSFLSPDESKLSVNRVDWEVSRLTFSCPLKGQPHNGHKRVRAGLSDEEA